MRRIPVFLCILLCFSVSACGKRLPDVDNKKLMDVTEKQSEDYFKCSYQAVGRAKDSTDTPANIAINSINSCPNERHALRVAAYAEIARQWQHSHATAADIDPMAESFVVAHNVVMRDKIVTEMYAYRSRKLDR